MKIKPIAWKRRWLSDRSGSWMEAKAGIFELCATESIWSVGMIRFLHEHSGKCRSIEDGKRKAEKWLKTQINKIVEG